MFKMRTRMIQNNFLFPINLFIKISIRAKIGKIIKNIKNRISKIASVIKSVILFEFNFIFNKSTKYMELDLKL